MKVNRTFLIRKAFGIEPTTSILSFFTSTLKRVDLFDLRHRLELDTTDAIPGHIPIQI